MEEEHPESVVNLPRLLRRGFGWAFTGRIVALTAGFVVNIMFARLLSPNDLGVFYLATSGITVLSLVASGGLPQILVRELAAHRTPTPILLVTGLRDATLRAVILSAIVGLGSGWVGRVLFDAPELGTVDWIVGAIVLLATLRLSSSLGFQGLGDIRTFTLVGDAGSSVLRLAVVGVFGLISTGLNLLTAFVIELFAIGAVAIAGLGLLYGRGLLTGVPLARLDRPSQEVRSAGRSLLVSELLGMLSTHGALWVAGALLLETEVARLGVALRLGGLVSLPLLASNHVLSPMIASLHTDSGRGDLESALRAMATVTSLVSAVPLTLMVVYPDVLLRMLFGSFFAAADGALLLVAVGHFANVLSGSAGQALAMTGHTRELMRISLVTVPASLGLAALLTDRFGISGLAAGLAAGILSQNIAMMVVLYRRTGDLAFAYLSVRRALRFLRS